MGCLPKQRLVMLRTPGIAGPLFQDVGLACVKSVGNAYGVNGPLSGPKAIGGVVIDSGTIQVTFSQCVNISGPTGIEYSLDGGAWAEVVGVVKISDTVYQFTTTPTVIEAGDDVRWRYIGGSNTIVDCEEAEDIGDQQIPVQNPLVLGGNFVLLETGGSDVVLVEEDPGDGSEGIQTEEAS